MATALLAAPAVVHADTVWLCRPGASPNPCAGSLKTTVKTFGKKPTVTTPKAVKDPAFDCFYVYPTVSQQSGPTASLSINSEEISIARYQAARFSEICKVYAPIYRQITLQALLTGGATQQDRDNAFADVRGAFEEYRAANPGRPYTLIGHSQGSGMLKRLMKEVIEPDEALRTQMVSAIISGSTVAVPVGQAVGGDFQSIPVCTKKKQINCVLSWATFGEKVPDASLFGRTSLGPGFEAACTNPASVGKNNRSKAVTYVRGKAPYGTMGVIAQGIYNQKVPKAKTPWLRPADRYTVQCVKSNGAHVLRAKPIGKSMKLQPSPSSGWGLHLIDINLPLGNLVNVVRAQQQTYAAQS
jgi:hypothetical protein